MKKYMSINIVSVSKGIGDSYIIHREGFNDSFICEKSLMQSFDELKVYSCKELNILDLNEDQYKLYEEYREIMVRIAHVIEQLNKDKGSDDILISQFNYMCGYQLNLVKRINKF